MLERRLCVYNAGFNWGLKVDASREIDCDYDVILRNTFARGRVKGVHTVVRRAFCFLRFALLFLGLMTHYRES